METGRRGGGRRGWCGGYGGHTGVEGDRSDSVLVHSRGKVHRQEMKVTRLKVDKHTRT